MYSFRNDYSELCHENILKNMLKVNKVQFDGYSEDEISKKVKEKLKLILEDNNVDIHLLSGGTQTNLVAISSILKPYQSIIAAESGHIATHEAGAIEATGHKVVTLNTANGKITSDQIVNVIEEHYVDEAREHITQPAMVYISNPTEFGTVYKYKELREIKDVCESYKIPLYIDGARLSQAISSEKSDIALKDLPKLCDIFYIGGTKNGAMFGECLVIVNDKYKKDFRYNLKQRGALLAKGFSVALQFDALFEDDLFLKLGKKANNNAKYIVDELSKLNINLLVEQESNQIFPIFNNDTINKLRENYLFYNWLKVDENHTAVRLCISWATERKIINDFIENVKVNL
ncbi:MAG: threonine aldolase family protein [Pleomorphochaeta sp.]